MADLPLMIRIVQDLSITDLFRAVAGRLFCGKPGQKVADIANALNVTVDYLIGQSDHIIMDKGLIRRMEDIEALPTEEKENVYYLIDMALAYNKTKKAFAH